MILEGRMKLLNSLIVQTSEENGMLSEDYLSHLSQQQEYVLLIEELEELSCDLESRGISAATMSVSGRSGIEELSTEFCRRNRARILR